MKIQIVKSSFAFIVVLLLSVSCSKNDDENSGPGNSKKVKYELSGNYTGKILLVTSTNSGDLQQFNNIAVPWSKELQYGEEVIATGAGLNQIGNG